MTSLPSVTPPHKEGERVVGPRHRAEMVRLAIARDGLFDFSEYDSTGNGPGYTVETYPMCEIIASANSLHLSRVAFWPSASISRWKS